MFKHNGVNLPARWFICSHCDGHGKSSAYLGAFSMEDLAEDPDFAEEYFAGGYDKPCPECQGTGKVFALDRETNLTPAQAEALADYDEQQEAYAACEAERRAELRHMGYN